MSSEQPLPSSFRDPGGFLFARDGTLYRQINRSCRSSYDQLMGSGLYRALTEEKLLVAHQETAEEPADAAEAYKVIRPQPVPFISYPYEWCFSQLKDAALLTLKIQRKALEFGMGLKDASAFNVQFSDGKPVLIDTLSFEPYPEGSPWIAYRQFCQHFLAPLALMSRRDGRLGRLFQLHLDGIPLDLADPLLPRGSRLSPGLLLHLHLHAGAQRWFGGKTPARTAQGMNRQALVGLADHLERTVQALRFRPGAGGWEVYYEQKGFFPKMLEGKKRVVEKFLDEIRPAPHTAWDLGANTGLFSRLVSRRGIFTVAWDADASCVERNYREWAAQPEPHLLPLVMDLTHPSPSCGWACAERASWLERGPVDLVLALALVHHLAIANNVPLDKIAGLLAQTGQWVVVEFVPKQDPQVQTMLAGREDIFPSYTQAGFEKALRARFAVRRSEEVPGTGRMLYLLERAQ